MKRAALCLLLALLGAPVGAPVARAQPSWFQFGPFGSNQPAGSSRPIDRPLVRGGIDDRPYLARAFQAVALGGYADLLGSYRHEEGVSQGFTFEARRFNLFVASRIADFVRLMAEVEFAHGAREIDLEMAVVDLLFHHAVSLRAGILLVPVGRFNLTHDAPRWDVVERPLVSTRIIPSTWADVGAGFFGALYPGRHRLTYEVYVINGLGDGLLAGEGTRIDAGRAPERFAADNNGAPSVVGRAAWETPVRASFAFSFHTGLYNRFQKDGLAIDRKRFSSLLALDAEVEAGPVLLRAEAAVALVEVPDGMRGTHATRQYGLYGEASWRLFRRRIGVFDAATLALVARVDWIDLFAEPHPLTRDRVGDETARLTAGLSFRPVPVTALRLAYHHDWIIDRFGRTTREGAVQVGLATYF